MMREYHVRICEGLGVKFPGSTRQRPALSNTMPVVSATAGLPQTADPLWLAFAMAVTGQSRLVHRSKHQAGLFP